MHVVRKLFPSLAHFNRLAHSVFLSRLVRFSTPTHRVPSSLPDEFLPISVRVSQRFFNVFRRPAKMKRAMLSLNPDAASYTPLDKRITEVKTIIADLSSSDSKDLCRTEQCQFHGEASSGSDNHAKDELHVGNNLTGMDSQNLSDQTKKQIVNDSHELDLAYLTFVFPNISEQCLADVYFLNGTDVESSVDMLNELESSPVDFTEQQPGGSNTSVASVSQVEDLERKVKGTGTGFSTASSSLGNPS